MNITKEKTVAEVVSENMGADFVFSKYKIDFCCGGGDTMDVACKSAGVDLEKVIVEIEAVNQKISGESTINNLDVPTLINQVKENYHTVISDLIFETLPYAEKVAKVHGASHHEVIEINQLVKDLDSVLTETFKNSIMSLYPVINEITELTNKNEEVSLETLQVFQKAIKRNEIAQKLIGDSLKEISKLSSDYNAPEDACNSYKFVYKILKQLQHEIHKYMHFEKNVLIPKVLNTIK